MNTHAFLNQLTAGEIREAIHAAERNTSGEIRVYVTHKECPDPVAAAQREFDAQQMADTVQRNAVLIFVAPASQTYAIIGDLGVHERCGPQFWVTLRDEMHMYLKRRRYMEAILHGVRRTGELLAEHFPANGANPNELSDEVLHD